MRGSPLGWNKLSEMNTIPKIIREGWADCCKLLGCFSFFDTEVDARIVSILEDAQPVSG